MQLAHCCDPALLNVPAWQLEHTLAPAAEYWPALHWMQADGRPWPTSELWVPAEHWVQLAAPASEYVPSAQLAQLLIIVAPAFWE